MPSIRLTGPRCPRSPATNYEQAEKLTRRLMCALNCSVVELAKLMGYSRSQVQNAMTGTVGSQAYVERARTLLIETRGAIDGC